MTEYIVPAKISKTIEKKASAIALEVYNAFELAGCARIDMLLNDELPKVIDINTSQGMTETSLVPKAWGKRPEEPLMSLLKQYSWRHHEDMKKSLYTLFLIPLCIISICFPLFISLPKMNRSFSEKHQGEENSAVEGSRYNGACCSVSQR